MTTMNISLSKTLKGFVDEQVASGAYVSSSEYLRDLIRKEQDRQKLRKLVVDGLESPIEGPLDTEYFNKLRAMVTARSEA